MAATSDVYADRAKRYLKAELKRAGSQLRRTGDSD